ncbi:DUF7500 family protein [Halobaculum roseum]|uniref:Uncharacterized protein n=1 Tax=Halobaculum roseum TaxID=2175149 RepID=A0ABD5MT24_9EURY|nr:hypothetical protein [Halobaculum roseum]QZY01514.1 hypothetical protein K6T36_09200 [Halobaculum roseum]
MSDDAPRGNPGVDPDDLDISKSEYVRELGDDRYVVSPGRRQPQQPPEEGRTEESSNDAGGDADAGTDAAEDPDVASTAESVRRGLSRTDGPGAVDAPADAAQSSPSSPSGSPPANSSQGVGDATRRSDDPARGDDGLPGDPTTDDRPTANDRPSADDRAESGGGSGGESGAESGPRDRPASHVRRGAPRGEAPASSADLDAGAVGEWLAASLADTEFAYGFDATLSLDGRTARHRMASDDVGETFETLVTWFADAAGGDTPTEDALGILLAGMDTGPRLSPNAVRSALAGLGVSRGDSVEDVLAAIEEAGGLRLE